MMRIEQNNPFARLPEVASFNVTSSDIRENSVLSAPQLSGKFGVEGGQDISPELKWSGAPEGTKSYAVTVYDPDAPTGSGFWHWSVFNIPADVTELATGAGSEGGAYLPPGATQLNNDASFAGFIGAAPPIGDGPHRYYFVVHALDVDDIHIPADSTPAFLGFNMLTHTLGRAVIVVTFER
ncbi:YbhB/YbcL family Raf kinase inhibitor-like protein [Paenibacillus xylanexedens]|nr:YbhB/YbcL family Raf kinase inhibitor-like protein [Paenibacillus xylanexedens]